MRDKGWISLRFLESDDQTISGAYNFVFENRCFSYQKGFDPAWDRFGPGKVMVYELLQEAFSEDRIELNFLQGDEPYKSDWTPHVRPLFGGNVYNRSFSGAFARSAFRLRRSAGKLLKAGS